MAKRDIVDRLTGLIPGMKRARSGEVKLNTRCAELGRNIHPAYISLDICDKLIGHYEALRATITDEQCVTNHEVIDALDKEHRRQIFDYNKCIGGLCVSHVDAFG